MSKTLYLLRHAKAVPWGPGIDDFSRRLAPRGRRHMQALAEWWDGHLEQPARILCSPSARTTETLAPLLALWPGALSDQPRALYGASAGRLMGELEAVLDGSDSLLMVGHNPGFEDLAFSLMGEADRNRHWKMATGTLAVFGFGRWPDPSRGDCRLRHWVTRDDLSVD